MFEKIAETYREAAATEFNNAAVDFRKREVFDLSMYFNDKAIEYDMILTVLRFVRIIR
jgi:hypothetical protein